MAHSRKIWQPYELEIMKQSFADLSTKDMAEILDRSVCSIIACASKLGLKKSEYYQKYLSYRFKGDEGIAYRFAKGHVPANKGQAMSDEHRERSRHTWFKKGHLPVNTLQDGAIRLRHSHKKRGVPSYYWIRISQANWRPLHVHLWEQANGPVPKGMNIVFKDRNTLNCTLENLEMISDVENMRRNSIQNYSPEIKSLIRLNSNLNKAINNATKQNR